MGTLTRFFQAVVAGAVLAASAGSAATACPFPEVVPLPDGWQAEGVATGRGSTAYAGSLATGAVWRSDLRTGTGDLLVPPQSGRVAVGLKYHRGQLFVAGGRTGQAYVYDADTGADIAVLQLGTPGATFINDVTVTTTAAWFTDSFQPVLYRLPLRHGRPSGPASAVALVGEWTQVAGFNANGIAATPDSRALLVVNSTVGKVYRVDPDSGVARAIRTTASLTSGDGILLRGHELAVVRNQLNEVVVLRLSPDLESAHLVDTLTDPDFAVPTTVAAFGGKLYAVNARFGTDPSPDVPYEIVKVDGS